MKLLLVTAGEIFGGVEACVETLTHSFLVKGIDVEVLVFYQGGLLRNLEAKSIPVTHIPYPEIGAYSTIKKIRAFLQDKQYSIVHSHGYLANLLISISLSRSSPRLVVTEHGQAESAKSRWVANRLRFAVTVSRLFACRRADLVVFVSEDLRSRTGSLYARVNTTVIQNGVFESEFRHQVRRGEKIVRICAIGRLSVVKGFYFLIDAISKIGSEIEVEAHIFGEGGLFEELNAQIRELSLEKKVFLRGFTECASQEIAESDLLIMPSLHEGLPLVLLEALSVGTPIIATHVGGIAENIVLDKEAILIPARDSDALADAIMALSRDPDRRVRLSHAARCAFEERYSAEKMANRYLRQYESIQQSGKRVA